MNEEYRWRVVTLCQVQVSGVLVEDTEGNQELQLWSDSGECIGKVTDQEEITLMTAYVDSDYED